MGGREARQQQQLKKAPNGCISLKGNQDGHTADLNDELATAAAYICKE